MIFEKIQYQLSFVKETFLIVIFNYSLVKAAMNYPHLCKLSKDCLMGMTMSMAQWCEQNASISSFSNCQRRNKDHCALAYCGGVVYPKLRQALLQL
jgi:hypothetical protein